MLGNRVPSKFQLEKVSTKEVNAGNYTDENQLINVNPEVPYWHMSKEGVLDYIAQHSPSIYAKRGSLYKYFLKDSVEEVESSVYRHKLKGVGKVKCHTVENMMVGITNPGYRKTPVTIKVNEKLWKSSDTVYPEDDPSLRFSVQGNADNDGTGYIYTLQHHTTNPNDTIPVDYIKAGVVWKKAGATFSEASSEYGSTYSGGTSIYTFESNIGSYSKQYEVTDQAYLYALRLKGKDANGRVMKNFKPLILPMPEGEFFAQVRTEQENEHFWGRYAGKNIIDPSTGLHRRIGQGVVEFFEDGNTKAYSRNNFRLGFLKNIFERFLYDRVEPGMADIKVWAGLGLMRLVDEALTLEYDRKAVETPFTNVVKNGSTYEGSKTSGHTLTDMTFLAFDLKPYGRITFEHLPMLDNTEMFSGRRDPKTGKPETSFWGFVPNLGTNTKQNFKLLRRKNSEQYTTVCHALSPMGYINSRAGKNKGYMSVSGKRTYSVHYGIQEGVSCKDTKNTLFLYPKEKF
jgi:hypothetical protein